MKITLLCTDSHHPVVANLKVWQMAFVDKGHEVELVYDKKEITGGDLLFLVSCSQLISAAEREKYTAVLILHASDLPQGRGWSPHVWSILNGDNEITVCLLEASEPVDSGDVWLSKKFSLVGHELLPEINEKLFQSELDLMSQAVEQIDQITPHRQVGEAGSYLQRRTPDDSRLDPKKTIAEQFDLLRVVDNQRYPAFVEYCGCRYLIKIEKVENDESE